MIISDDLWVLESIFNNYSLTNLLMSTDFTLLHYAYILKVLYQSNLSLRHWKVFQTEPEVLINYQSPSLTIISEILEETCLGYSWCFYQQSGCGWFLTLPKGLENRQSKLRWLWGWGIHLDNNGRQVYSLRKLSPWLLWSLVWAGFPI